MPYKDPEKARESARVRQAAYRARMSAERREKVRAYQNAYNMRYRERLGDELRARKRDDYHAKKPEPAIRQRMSSDQKKAAVAARSVLDRAIKATGARKNAKSFDLLGYSLGDFAAHISKQFSSDMSWSNHGKAWHIDHVAPVSVLVRLGITAPHVVNALRNLRPLCASDNLKKSGTITAESVGAIVELLSNEWKVTPKGE